MINNLHKTIEMSVMKHKHHINPRHSGGGDEPSNLVELTIAEHAEAHKRLFEKYGKKEDFIARKALAGSITKEEFLAERASLGGQKAQLTLRKMKLSAFYNEELHERSVQLSVISHRENKTGFCDKRIQSELGTRGGSKNKGFIWFTNGIKSIKYTRKMQQENSLIDF
jgi:hypothetical protein